MTENRARRYRFAIHKFINEIQRLTRCAYLDKAKTKGEPDIRAFPHGGEMPTEINSPETEIKCTIL